jgi:hypothetical protein
MKRVSPVKGGLKIYQLRAKGCQIRNAKEQKASAGCSLYSGLRQAGQERLTPKNFPLLSCLDFV